MAVARGWDGVPYVNGEGVRLVPSGQWTVMAFHCSGDVGYTLVGRGSVWL